MKQKILIFIALLSIGFTSCDLGDDPVIGGTATQAVAGGYFFQLFFSPGGGLYLDYSLMTISNTSANVPNKIRVSDDGHIWNFTGEFDVDLGSQTFSGTRVPNAFYDATPDPKAFDPIGTIVEAGSDYPKYMTITDGVIIDNVANVPSTAPSDSIAFYATGLYVIDRYRVASHISDTVSTDPLVIDMYNVYEFVEETADGEPDGPYFLSGYQRTGFLEDEH